MRRDALAAARIERGKYNCAICNQIFGPKEIHVDHIEPAGSLINDLGGFCERLFCESNGLRVLCAACHKEETAKFRNLTKS